MRDNGRRDCHGTSLRGARRSDLWLALIGLLVLTLAIAAISGAVTAGSVDGWGLTLNKPASELLKFLIWRLK